jgi:hypothetical protein
MPIGSILISAAVVSVFVVFAGVLIWGNFQTEPARAGTGQAQQKTPQLLVNLLPATNRTAPVFPNKIDFDQIIGGGITADAQAQLRKRIDK